MPNRIRIVFLIPSLTRGGAERQVLALMRDLDRSRFDPTLVLFEKQQESDSYEVLSAVESIRSLDIPAGGNFRPQRAPMLLVAATRLARILHELRADVLHTFLPAPAMVGCIANRIAKVPVFIVGRRSMAGLYRRNSLFLKWMDRVPLQCADALVSNCKAITAEAIAVDGIERSRAFTIYNGIDTHIFHEGSEPARRRELGFAPEDVVFGAIANFDASKRHIDLVHAGRCLRNRVSHSKFLMVGADRGELPFLRSEIERLGLEQAFVILPRTREPERLHRLIDVYVSASATEGMSNSVLEAMGSGKPVIATAVGGNPELVTPLTNGFLIPPCLPEAIATCGEKLCTDMALRLLLGRNSRRIAEQQFSTGAMVRVSEELYVKLLSRAKALPRGARPGPAEPLSLSHS